MTKKSKSTPLKVIVAGSRQIDDIEVVQFAIKTCGFEFSELVCGKAPGVDTLAESLAMLHGIPVREFPANWKKHGRAAGPIRNREMAAYADALVAVWDGYSAGTKNMIEEMEKLGKPVFRHMAYQFAKRPQGVSE